MNKIKYPVYEPFLGGNEKKYVNDCLDTTWISGKGKYVDRFENSFSEYSGVKNSVSVCNGTVALHLALVALGIGPGDEVIVPTLTYIASVNAITYTGATPVFVDSSYIDWQVNPKDIEQKLTSRTKAIMCVHLYGQSCDMDALVSISRTNELYLIEDCAEALGTFFKNKHVGGFGDVATFSFYGNKTITTGEGGMVVTNDDTLFDKIVRLKGQGLAKDREYWHDLIGYNYRMTNICAAIGLAQLERIDETITKKRQLASWYLEDLKDSPFELHRSIEYRVHSYWMCTVLIPENSNRQRLRDHLMKHGIETRPMFYPIHTMPIYQHIGQNHHPVAESLAKRGINLPSYPGLKRGDVSYISNTLLSYDI